MAPNLKAIVNFPIQLLRTFATAQWTTLLKTLDESWLEDDDNDYDRNEIKTVFEKLAEMQPKLTAFSLPSDFALSTCTNAPYLRSLLFTTLQSSSHSLKFLSLEPAKKISNIQQVPPLRELNTLQFHSLGSRGSERTQFFFGSMEISLEEMFPNVREVCLSFHSSDDAINHYFPENIIIPWGSKIRKLTLQTVASSALPLLQKRFPFLQELYMSVPTSEIIELLTQLAQLWPKLNSLALDLLYGYYPAKPNASRIPDNTSPVILDSAFTGLPQEIVNQLLDPLLRKNFTSNEIRGFKDRSPISLLKELKELKLIYKGRVVEGESVKKVTRITRVSNEFGFQLLPQLIVTLQVQKYHDVGSIINTALQPMARCNNIQIDYDDFFHFR